jgi:intein/homing endonuclease
MARKWTKEEVEKYKKELQYFYIKENKSIAEISTLLGISEKTVFKRLQRLNIKTNPSKKLGFRNKRNDIIIPKNYSENLAEVFGILLGDGHISKSQVLITLGSKEESYGKYVQKLFGKVFKCRVNQSIRNGGYLDMYIGSVELAGWFIKNGMVHHKVKSQVNCPLWIRENEKYIKRFLRGFFDTDGTVYKLRFGAQIAFTNASLPLLQSTRNMLLYLKYSPSLISSQKVYLTRRENLDRFFKEINPKNQKHIERFNTF